MGRRKNYQGKKHQKKRPYQKPQNNQNNPIKISDLAIKVHQLDFWVRQMSKRIEGIVYAFDKYLKMKGDTENLSKMIKEEFDSRKKQESKSVKSNRHDSKSSK